MRVRLRSIIVASYLLLSILLGGSAQGLWTNLTLQLLGIGLIAWAALAAEPAEDSSRISALLYGLIAATMLLVLLQLIPLPANVWAALPGREALTAAYRLLGETLPALPLSEAPYRSVASLFWVIPGLALFISVKLLRPSPRWLALAVVLAMACSITLGAVQVAGGRDSWAYLYPITNDGAVGVFANRNHMGTLLLVSIPFAAALLVSARSDKGGSAQGTVAMGIAALILVIIGILLNGSLAAMALALPVLVASAALLPAAVRWRRIALTVSVVAIVAGVAVLATTPIATTLSSDSSSASVQSRSQIWKTTGQAIRDTFPAGTGLGTFEQVYRQYEDPSSVTSEYVNHAHNDFLELTLELGAPGAVLILLFLAWWGGVATRAWTSPLSTAFGRAGTIASGAVLAHSIVDYPLRTAAIGAVFGVAIALMAERLRSTEPSRSRDRRPAKHVKLG